MTFPLTDSELAAFQTWVVPALRSKAQLFSRSVDHEGDYGEEESYGKVGEPIDCWLRSTPNPVQVADSGAVITVNTYRLFVKFDIGWLGHPGDQVVVTDRRGIEELFTISDDTVDNTWPALIGISLRRRE